MDAAAAADGTGEAIAARIGALVAREGSAAHRYLADPAIGRGGAWGADLADAVHLICALHGRVPGLLDIAAEQPASAPVRAWAARAAEGFARERGLLTRLVVAAGPRPSTPGQAKSEAAVLGQRRALETLARSERSGVAIGAAIALALDWRGARGLLALAAERLGVEPPLLALPDERECLETARLAAASPAAERALLFGADQLLAQHRALWDLLEARRAARA